MERWHGCAVGVVSTLLVIALAGCGGVGPTASVTPSAATSGATATPGGPSAEPGPTTTPGPTATQEPLPGVTAAPSASAAPSPTTIRPITPSPTTMRPTTVRPTTVRPTTVRPTTTTAPPTSCSIPASLRGKDLTSLGTTAKVIALTFDGGGSNAGTASILATLADMSKPATFFLTGDFVDAYPASARRIAASYPLGNHTQNHPDLTTLSNSRVVDEIRLGAASIRRATGVDPRPYFRFPLGARDARTIALVNDECYVPFRWTVDSLGWKGTKLGGMTAAKVTQRVLDGATPGGIILMHLGANPDDGTTLDADALPAIIRGLRERGYTLVTLERVLPATP